MDAPSALTEKALAGGLAAADVSRFSLKSSMIRSPAMATVALLSLGGVMSTSELLTTAATLFSPVVKSATSLLLVDPMASLPASDRS